MSKEVSLFTYLLSGRDVCLVHKKKYARKAFKWSIGRFQIIVFDVKLFTGVMQLLRKQLIIDHVNLVI